MLFILRPEPEERRGHLACEWMRVAEPRLAGGRPQTERWLREDLLCAAQVHDRLPRASLLLEHTPHAHERLAYERMAPSEGRLLDGESLLEECHRLVQPRLLLAHAAH